MLDPVWYLVAAFVLLALIALILRFAWLEDRGEKQWLQSDEVPGPPLRVRRYLRKVSTIIGAVIEALLQG